ncbi:MAG: DUF2798 domain-containing protein [Rhodocyclaceae bacterium]|nr:DUF2798 domain-containing protein [Rhodocyclaceae bacterium]
MIPRRYAPLLFSLILSGQMSLLVSGVATLRVTGPDGAFAALWFSAWLTAWTIAFPAVMLAAPLTRHIVNLLLRDG